jgi:hypothetical protein
VIEINGAKKDAGRIRRRGQREMATKTIDVAEQKRLNEAREGGIPWKK